MPAQTTIVTGIWDLGRDQAGEGFARDFAHYRARFAELLVADVPMVIYGDAAMREFVAEARAGRPTQFIDRPASHFREQFEFFRLVEAIRLDPKWRAQASWLPDSPQATLALYNPMVMSKMFMLHDAAISNPFGADRLAWIDGGITNTVHPGYFSKDRVLERVWSLLDRFFFVSFPYREADEIHGFARDGMKRFCGVDPQFVCRGGFFGGHRDVLSEVNQHYYALLSATLHERFMGTEENLFTLMAIEEPELYTRYELQDEHHGLLESFFEHVKALPRPSAGIARRSLDPQLIESRRERRRTIVREIPARMVAGYIVTYNAPDQLDQVLASWVKEFRFDRLYVLDHSTEDAARLANSAVAARHDATMLYHPQGNGGISGGRQFVAEHFDASDADYCVFIEDDMFYNDASVGPVCRHGFRTYLPGLRDTAVRIMELEGYDFLKLSFTEFYGSNHTQVAWYNVDDDVRKALWPEQHKLPRSGFDIDSPPTRFDAIRTYDGLSYAEGEVYYCNWPQIVSRQGNRRMFFEPALEEPSEKQWMAQFFERTLSGELRPAVLLASPITHNRFHHYSAAERREN